MSDIVTPRDLPDELTEIINPETLIEIYNPDTARNEKIKKENFNIDGVRLNADRISSKELILSPTASSGYFTIATMKSGAGESGCAYFNIATAFGTVGLKVRFKNSGATKTHQNEQIEIDGFSYNVSVNEFLTGFRIAKSDSVDAGAKLQIAKNSTNSGWTVNMSKNVGRTTGWELVTPFLDNTPTLPDGVTAGTFLEAGEEMSFDGSVTVIWAGWIAWRDTDNILRCVVDWPEIPKHGTGLTLTLPSIALIFYDGAGNASSTISGGQSISNFEIIGQKVIFYINDTGAFAGLNAGAIHARTQGTGCKLTIT